MASSTSKKQRVYVASGLNILAAAWLILSPFTFNYAHVPVAMWNSIVIGAAVAALAIVRVARPAEHEGVSWTNCVLGLWLIFAPFVLGHWTVPPAVWNEIIIGAIIVALAATSASATRTMHQPAHA